jgi:hypothetical protein
MPCIPGRYTHNKGYFAALRDAIVRRLMWSSRILFDSLQNGKFGVFGLKDVRKPAMPVLFGSMLPNSTGHGALRVIC